MEFVVRRAHEASELAVKGAMLLGGQQPKKIHDPDARQVLEAGLPPISFDQEGKEGTGLVYLRQDSGKHYLELRVHSGGTYVALASAVGTVARGFRIEN